MALGQRDRERQGEFWPATGSLAGGPGHVFYDRLNRLLAEANFDSHIEELCAPYDKAGGRGSIPPGNDFRMLFIGYLEGLDSQRGIDWRCNDSLSLRRFLDVPLDEETLDHSSLTRIRNRLPLEVHRQVFQCILKVVQSHRLINASSAGIDSTMLEAGAAMKSIVRKETGEDWNAYLLRLMKEEGAIEGDERPREDELRRFDKQRGKHGKKKVSNDEWQSSSDTEARIVKMKDGRTHLGYKAEHVIDLESEYILSARVSHGTDADTETLLPSVGTAQENLEGSGGDQTIAEAVADAGYHGNETIYEASETGVRTYIPEPKTRFPRRWTNKPEGYQDAVYNNRRRNKRDKGRSYQQKRSERVERSFAHVCETGGARRSWLRGLAKINKRYLIQAAARNLGLLMLQMFGVGKSKGLQGEAGMPGGEIAADETILEAFWPFIGSFPANVASLHRIPVLSTPLGRTFAMAI